MPQSNTATRHGKLFAKMTDAAELAQAWLAVLSHYPVNQRPLEISELQQTGTQRLEALHTQLIEERYEPEPAALIASPIGS